jgi:DNA-binding SARP family transcriptional activator
MLTGRIAPPLPDTGLPQQLSFQRPVAHRLVEIITRPGGLLVRRLAADLADMDYEVAWARPLPFEVESSSLGTLLLRALAIARQSSRSGKEPLVVIELPTAGQVETLVSQLLAPDAYGAVAPSVVLVMDALGGTSAAPSASILLEVPSVSPRMARGLVSERDSGVISLRQLSRAAGGLASLVDGAVRCLPQLGAAELAGIVAKTREPAALTRALASRILSEASAEKQAAVEMSGRLGYAHAQLRALEPATAGPGEDPWWIPLSGGWLQVDPAWREALMTMPARASGVERSACLNRLVADLVEEGAVHEAIELCIGAGWHGLAADLLAGEAERLECAGRHTTLIGWLVRLPAEETHSHSGLATFVPELRRTAGQQDQDEKSQRTPLVPVTRSRSPRYRFFRTRSSRQADLARPPLPPPADSPRLTESGDSPGDPGSATPSPVPGSRISGTPSVRPRAGTADPASQVRVEALLLGSFELYVDGDPVRQWRGNRGRLLLAYLLLHYTRPVHRDALGGVFWPEVTPDVARNRLHVALHGLRSDLRAVSRHPIVVHSQGGFTFHSRVALSIDTEAFTAAVRTAHGEEGSQPEAALGSYEKALEIYRGDLLEDAPYEDWALLDRERLKVQYLETLDRIAKIRFELGRYAACIEVSQRLATGDPCREDIHRLLMRCYARLNKPHLAVHQYHQCERQLRDETGLKPAQTTRNLYEQIRHRQLV